MDANPGRLQSSGGEGAVASVAPAPVPPPLAVSLIRGNKAIKLKPLSGHWTEKENYP